MKKAPLIIGGVCALGGGVAALILVKKHEAKIKDAIQGVAPPAAPGQTNTVSLRLTHYWPFKQGMTAAQQLMEGGVHDALSKPLHTVEDFFAGKADYVSLSGDLQGHKGTIWPVGQKLIIPWGDKTITGRVVDTGDHFHGAGKVFRVLGSEPIDVCVYSSDNAPPKSVVDAQVVVGDTFDKAGAVAKLDKAGHPQVTGLVGINIFASRST
jgi:hypothetical protein